MTDHVRFIRTEYYIIDPKHPERALLSGKYNGEFLGQESYAGHLAPAFDVPESRVGIRYAREGNGDIVVCDISQAAWNRICHAVSTLDHEDQNDRIKVSNAIFMLPYITFPLIPADIERFNCMARAELLQ